MIKTNLKNDHILSFKTQVKLDAKFACVGVLKYAPIKTKNKKKRQGKSFHEKIPLGKMPPRKTLLVKKLKTKNSNFLSNT